MSTLHIILINHLPECIAGKSAAYRRIFMAFIAFVLLTGCTTPLKGRPDLLEFLVDGQTSRTMVLQKLGPPTARFERDNILTYRLAYDERNKGYLPVLRERQWDSMWSQARHSLVLVFDSQGILTEHSLVEVNYKLK
jgi:hypothetical protein